MRKPRSNSKWNQLSSPQRRTVEKWLFEEHLSYDEVAARMKSEFGLEASIMSVCRYYCRRARERQSVELVEAQAMADGLTAPELNTDTLRAAAVKLIAKMTLKLACEKPDRLKDLESLTRLLLFSEDNDIRRGRLRLERAQFNWETTEDASGELPKLARLLVKIEEDDELTEQAKMEKVHALLYSGAARHGAEEAGQDRLENGD